MRRTSLLANDSLNVRSRDPRYGFVSPCRQQISVEHALHLIPGSEILGAVRHELRSHHIEHVQAIGLNKPASCLMAKSGKASARASRLRHPRPMLEIALTAFTTFFAVIGPVEAAVLLPP